MPNKKAVNFIVLLILLGLSSSIALAAEFSETGKPVTLKQCYEWAKLRSEDLQMRLEDIKQSKARARSALGNALPDVKWELTNTWQQPAGVEELESRGFTGFVEKEQTESKFSLQQPLFSGLREFSSMSAFKKQSVRDSLLFERASLDLFDKTADAFYTILSLESDLDNTNAAFLLAQDRIKELRDFLKLGKTRESEVFTAKAYSAGLKANMDQIQAKIHSAREELSFLTDRDLTTIPLVDEITSSPVVQPLNEALQQAQGRADLRAQQEEVEAMKLRIRYQKGFFWPTADVAGNYYTQRATFLDAIDWDVVLSVEMPLYQGGTVSADVREAWSAYRQAVLTLDKMRRMVFYSVRKIHGELTSAIQETQSLEEAVQAAQQSYESARKEYRLGLVTNLDVLQGLDFLQRQKSARDAARFKVKRLFIQLDVATDRITGETL